MLTHHPLSPVIKLGFHPPQREEEKKKRKRGKKKKKEIKQIFLLGEREKLREQEYHSHLPVSHLQRPSALRNRPRVCVLLYYIKLVLGNRYGPRKVSLFCDWT